LFSVIEASNKRLRLKVPWPWDLVWGVRLFGEDRRHASLAKSAIVIDIAIFVLRGKRRESKIK
jgi:hypothetical protein